MKVLAVIPARAGSKRVPGKNLRKLGGKELVARSIEICLGARRVMQVLLSSDSDEALAICSRYAGVTALRRPAELASDTSPAIDYVRHALEQLPAGSFDAVAIVQPSSPLTVSADVDATLELLEQNPDADSAVSVMPVEHALHPVKFKRLEGTRLVGYLEEERGRMMAHELPPLFVRNCSVYASWVRTVERGTIIGDDSRGYVMPRERSVDINDELDWQWARFLFEQAAAGPG